MYLVAPSEAHLPSYVRALERGWSPDDTPETARRILHLIEQSPNGFLKRFDNPEGSGEPIRLPTGFLVHRIPTMGRWMWDGEFSGTITLRWPKDGTELPPEWLGHIAYAVVPWKQRQGYATLALRRMLAEAKKRGFSYLEVVANVDNAPSQQVILTNGGILLERFEKLPANGGGEALRFRIVL